MKYKVHAIERIFGEAISDFFAEVCRMPEIAQYAYAYGQLKLVKAVDGSQAAYLKDYSAHVDSLVLSSSQNPIIPF